MTIQSGSGGKWWFNGLPFQTVQPITGTVLGGQKYWFNGLPLSPYSEILVTDTSLAPSLVVDTDTFYVPFVGMPSDVTLTAPLVIDTDIVYTPTVNAGAVTLSPSLVVDTDTFYTPTLTNIRVLTPGIVTDADTFFVPAVTKFGTLLPSPYDDIDIFYVPTFVPGAVTLTVSLYDDTAVFYSPSIDRGISPSFVTDTDIFFAPVITKLSGILPSLYDDTDTFYVTAAVPGSVSRQADLVTDTDVIYQTFTGQFNQIRPSLVISTDNFFVPVLSKYSILLPDLVDSDTVITPPVIGSTWFINTLFVNEDTAFYPLSVSIYNNVLPSFVDSSELLYTPALIPGPVSIFPGRVIDTDIFLTAFVGIVDNTPNPIGGDPSNLPGNLKYVSAITMTQSGLILSVEARVNTAKTVNTRMVIYDNSAAGGMPGALLGVTNDKTTVVSGANLYTLRVPVSVLAGQTIWAGIHSDGGFQWLLANSKNGSKYNTDTWAGGASDPFGPTSNDNKKAPIVVYYLQAAYASMTVNRVIDIDIIYPPSRSSSNTVTMPHVIDTDFFYPVTVSEFYPLFPSTHMEDDIFHAATVSVGAVTLQPPLIADDTVFYSPSVERFALQISNVFSAVVPNDDTFYSPTVTMDITLFAALVVDTDVFYGTVVNRIGAGVSNVFSAAMPSDDNIYTATVRLASVSVSPTNVVDTDIIYSPIVERLAPLIETIFSASMPSTDVIYQATVTLLGANLPPLLVLDVDVIYSPSILSRYILSTGVPPSALDSFYVPVVTEGGVTLAPVLINSGLDIWPPDVSTTLDNRTLLPSRVPHDDTFYIPRSDGGFVSSPSGASWKRQVYVEGKEARINVVGVTPTPELVE